MLVEESFFEDGRGRKFWEAWTRDFEEGTIETDYEIEFDDFWTCILKLLQVMFSIIIWLLLRV